MVSVPVLMCAFFLLHYLKQCSRGCISLYTKQMIVQCARVHLCNNIYVHEYIPRAVHTTRISAQRMSKFF